MSAKLFLAMCPGTSLFTIPYSSHSLFSRNPVPCGAVSFGSPSGLTCPRPSSRCSYQGDTTRMAPQPSSRIVNAGPVRSALHLVSIEVRRAQRQQRRDGANGPTGLGSRGRGRISVLGSSVPGKRFPGGPHAAPTTQPGSATGGGKTGPGPAARQPLPENRDTPPTSRPLSQPKITPASQEAPEEY